MTPGRGAEIIAKVRADLARASREDADRRVRCIVCQAMTRDLPRHEALHGVGHPDGAA
jgi:hypothetical protein